MCALTINIGVFPLSLQQIWDLWNMHTNPAPHNISNEIPSRMTYWHSRLAFQSPGEGKHWEMIV